MNGLADIDISELQGRELCDELGIEFIPPPPTTTAPPATAPATDNDTTTIATTTATTVPAAGTVKLVIVSTILFIISSAHVHVHSWYVTVQTVQPIVSLLPIVCTAQSNVFSMHVG